MEKLPQVYQTVVTDVMSQCYTLFDKNGDCTRVLRKLKQLWVKKLLTKVDDYVDLDKFFKETVPPKLKTKTKNSLPTIKMKNNNIIKYNRKSMLKPSNLSMPDIGFHEKTSSTFGFQNGITELLTNGGTCNGTHDVNKLENRTSATSVAPLKIGKKRYNATQAGLKNEKEIAGPAYEFNAQDEVVSLPKKLKMDNRGELCDNSQMQTCGIQRKSTQKIRRKFVNSVNVKKRNLKTLDRRHSLIPKQKNSQHNNLKLGGTPHKANHICNGRLTSSSGKSQEQNTCVDNVDSLKHNDHHDNFDNAVSKQDFVETVPDSVINDKNISLSKTNSPCTTCDGSHKKRSIRLYRRRLCVEQSRSNKSSLEPVTRSGRSHKQNMKNATTNCVPKTCEKMVETGYIAEHKLSPKQSGGEQCDNFTATRINMPLVTSQVSNKRRIRLNRNGKSLVKENIILDTNLHHERDKTEKYIYTFENAYSHRKNITKCKKVKIVLPARMGFTKDELTCIIKVPPWALQGSKLPTILTPIIRRIHVNNLSILEATSSLQEHINNYNSILQVDGLGVKFVLKCRRNSSTIPIRKRIKDNSVIDSDDDITDEEDIISAFQAKNVIFCQFTNVKHYRNVWRLYLKNGIMRLNGKDYCFNTAEGIVTW